MPLFMNTLMLAGVVLAALPVIIHLFFRLRRRRVVFPALRFLKRTQTVQNSRLKLRDLILLLCRAAAILCLVFAFARPYFIGQQLEAGVESGAVDLVLIVDNSASMSYKPDQLSRLDVAREQALTLIAQRQTGDRIAVLESTRPNDPTQRLDNVLARAQAAAKGLPQRLSIDHPIAALVTACNSFADDPANKRTHRVVCIGDFQDARWTIAELQRQVAPLVDKYRIEVNLLDLSGPTPAPVGILKPDTPAPRRNEILSANATLAGIDFNLKGRAPRQPSPVTVTIHRVDDKPVGVLPVKLTVLPPASKTGTSAPVAAPFLGSLTMAGSGDGRVTLEPTFPQAGWQVIKVEVVSRDPLPADDTAYAAAPLTERPSVLVVDGAADDDDVHEDETRGQAYFLAQALNANVNEQGRELDVKVVAPAGLSNLALANSSGVVLCGVSALAPTQVQSLEQFVQNGGDLL
ncbi:MAG TPA: BatA and WFA domain-containing protein, partial [Planctomycetota bacterium]|nr:BatA and WFA domain-containing protein [Planctomycetota bacterium]